MEVRALYGCSLAAGGLCCRSPRSAPLEKHQLGGSCCCFPDNCTHCAASVVSRVSPCLCRDSDSWERGLLTRGEEVGRRRRVLQPPLLFTCSVFILEAKHTWVHMHIVPGVSLAAAPLYSWLLCSEAPPALHSLPFSFLSHREDTRECSWATSYSLKQA